jgi:hypothetical protein
MRAKSVAVAGDSLASTAGDDLQPVGVDTDQAPPFSRSSSRTAGVSSATGARKIGPTWRRLER